MVNNANGELSAHYPSQLIIMEAEQPSGGGVTDSTSTIYESVHDGNKLRELFGKARSARCRARFPVPVILFHGRNICRYVYFKVILRFCIDNIKESNSDHSIQNYFFCSAS